MTRAPGTSAPHAPRSPRAAGAEATAEGGGAAVRALAAAGAGRGSPVAVVPVGHTGVALAHGGTTWAYSADPAAVLRAVEAAFSPRWVWWTIRGTGSLLAGAGDDRSGADAGSTGRGLRPAGDGGTAPALCWDLAAVHRVLHGGRRDDPGAVWAAVRGLPPPPSPPRHRSDGQLDLLATIDESPKLPDTGDAGRVGDDVRADGPVGADGQLRPGWIEETLRGTAAGGVDVRLARAERFAELALVAMAAQERTLRALPDPRVRPTGVPLAVLTARAESAAELLAHELARRGLPVHRPTAERTIAGIIGPRPRDETGRVTARQARDAPVLRHLGPSVDLRSPLSLRAGLAAVGIDVPDTRSWRLTALRGAHPVIEPLLAWRRAERIATTYGFGWLDDHVGADGRLRGGWRGSDGAAGRMTADAGLHSLPGDLRVAVIAEPGYRFVRADLGQIEPRVLAVVSGDPELARATAQDDLYAPVAARLRVDRPTAKVAVLAAMYGQTSGAAGQALRQMRRTYPVALAYLDAAEAVGREPAAPAGVTRPPLRTFGGRRIPLPVRPDGTDEADGARDPERVNASWGRFARNAVVQGAAAELFKAWAVTVRQLLVPLGGEIVLCLHDELLLHVPTERADEVVAATRRALDATAGYWAAGSGVRFVADITVSERWSDAKS
ncbi:DNA polymerase [Frankia sp. Cpl3]|uniref:DNA polymerase n=1 Tax=Parafrankia colletiae TaxID=573497 RepID=UPI001F527719|nr:DNA polymerase [Parafrankia colletiae]MCK9904229.1 DNA polymerase [Frankia sp. Cpl3]